MSVILHNETPRQTIQPGRERYLAHSEHMMMVVMDFDDGPGTEPDAPHRHPHEQITYVAEGRVLFFLGEAGYELGAGDMIVVPSDIPHAIQLLTAHARLVDTFSPVREDFLDGKQP